MFEFVCTLESICQISFEPGKSNSRNGQNRNKSRRMTTRCIPVQPKTPSRRLLCLTNWNSSMLCPVERTHMPGRAACVVFPDPLHGDGPPPTKLTNGSAAGLCAIQFQVNNLQSTHTGSDRTLSYTMHMPEHSYSMLK